MNEEFRVLTLELKKRKKATQVKHSPSNYYIWGYYDSLDIRSRESWLALSPQNMYDGKNSNDEQFMHSYPIKLIFPKESEYKKLDKTGFNYKYWSNSDETNIKNKAPFLGIVMINICREAIVGKNFNDLNVEVISLIVEKIRKLKIKFSDLNCGVFPTIGYFDFAILFRTDNLTKVSAIVEEIKELDCFSNTCIISGLYAKTTEVDLESISSKKWKQPKLTIRFNLNPEVTPKMFFEAFDNKIKIKKKEKIKYYNVFGSSDCLMLPEHDLLSVAPLFLENGLFHPSNAFYKKNLKAVHSSVTVPHKISTNKLVQSSCGVKPFSYDKYEDRIKQVSKTIVSYSEYMERNKLPTRACMVLTQIERCFHNLKTYSHTFDIFETMLKVFESFTFGMEQSIEKIEKIKIHNQKDFVKKNEMQKGLDETVLDFRNYVGTYLSDLVFSDRALTDGSLLAHPSISSATKLLFAYNQIINDIVNLLKGNKNTYTFFVTSGGCDNISAVDMFDFLGLMIINKKVVENDLIIIQLPENNMFNVKYTLFTTLHECFHFCGDRLRAVRRECVCAGISRYIAAYFADIFISIETKKIRNGIFENLSMPNKAKRKFVDIVKSNKELFTKEISKNINEVLEEKCKTFKHSDDYGRIFYEKICNILVEMFVLNGSKGTPMVFDLYKNIEKTTIDIWEETIDACKGDAKLSRMEIILTTRNYYLEKYTEAESKQEPKIIDQNIKNMIGISFEAFIGNFITLPKNEDSAENHNRFTKNLQDTIDAIKDVYSECYSDCITIEVLKLKLPDFLFGYISECSGIDTAFSKNELVHVLRIGADLKICYNIERELTDENKDDIRAEYHLLKNEKRKCDFSIDDLLNRINIILQEYENIKEGGLNLPLEEYLSKCVDLFKGEYLYPTNIKANKVWEELEALNNNSSRDKGEEIYKMVDSLFNFWCELAN